MWRTIKIICFLSLVVWLVCCNTYQSPKSNKVLINIKQDTNDLGFWYFTELKQNKTNETNVKTNNVTFLGKNADSLPENGYIYDTLTLIMK